MRTITLTLILLASAVIFATYAGLGMLDQWRYVTMSCGAFVVVVLVWLPAQRWLHVGGVMAAASGLVAGVAAFGWMYWKWDELTANSVGALEKWCIHAPLVVIAIGALVLYFAPPRSKGLARNRSA